MSSAEEKAREILRDFHKDYSQWCVDNASKEVKDPAPFLASYIVKALQEREMPVRSIIEDFIDRRVKYFGDTTKTVLVDELMSALGREMKGNQDE